MAPVARVNEGERELTMMRWGMPNPPQLTMQEAGELNPGFLRETLTLPLNASKPVEFSMHIQRPSSKIGGSFRRSDRVHDEG
jgi:hypothetical protein